MRDDSSPNVSDQDVGPVPPPPPPPPPAPSEDTQPIPQSRASGSSRATEQLSSNATEPQQVPPQSAAPAYPQQYQQSTQQPAPQQYRYAPSAAAPRPPDQFGFGAAVKNQWTVAKLILSGHVPEAFSLATSNRFHWVVTLGALVVAGAMIAPLSVWHGATASRGFLNELYYGLGSVVDIYGQNVGIYFRLFMVGLITLMVAIVVRALLLKALFALRGVSVPVTGTLTILAVALQWTALLVTVGFVLMLIPSPRFAVLITVVGSILLSLTAFMAELLTYIGVNRAARFERSIVVPYTLSVAATGVILAIVYALLLYLFV